MANKTELKEIKKTNKGFKRRSFLGCVTCRNRKVKCDGRRPQCLRCEKSKRNCEGYGFKLKFTDPYTLVNENQLGSLKVEVDEDTSKFTKRQQLPFINFPPSQIFTTFDEIDKKLDDLESLALQHKNFNIGPFGVFVHSSANNLVKNEVLCQKAKTAQQIVPKEVSISIDNKQIINNMNENRINDSNISNKLMQSDNDFLPAPINIRRVLPLVPALEIHHQRRKQQNERDSLFSLSQRTFSFEDINNYNHLKSSSEVRETPIWIHPRLEIDAILTYQALIGSADLVSRSSNIIKQVIFSEKYDTTSQLKNRILDKMCLSKAEIDRLIKYHTHEVIKSLNADSYSTLTSISFTGLLRSQRVQELVRLFVKSQPSIMHLTYNGCVFNTIVIPLLYKIVGELLVFESSVGLPGDWSGKVLKDGIEFRDYCDILKRTYCMVSLSMAAFFQYKILFNEYGIYDGSLKLFRCYISFREMSLVNLAILIKPLIQKLDNNSEYIKFTNHNLIDRLIKVGLFKELLLTLILAIYQDSNLDIINNYNVLYAVLEGINNYYKKFERNMDSQLEEIWEWFRFLHIFYKSCSKIDLENYEINDEGFEDVKSDYNLIENFKFNDYFEQNEFNKIEIRPETNSSISFHVTDNQSGDGETSNAESDFDSDIDDVEIELPTRLAKRPLLEDKPPRTFTVRFHFTEDVEDDQQKSSDSEYYDDDDNYDGSEQELNKGNNKDKSYDAINLNSLDKANALIKSNQVMNHINENLIMKPKKNRLHDSRKEAKLKINLSDVKKDPGLEFKDSHISPAENIAVNTLTGLAITQSKDMGQNEREQNFMEKGKIKIPHPSSTNFKDNSNKPSSIELSFGLPLSLLELMERTVRLADHKNWCLRKKIFPRNFPKICCDLEEDLINWKSDWDLYSKERRLVGALKFHSLFHQALYHLTVSFYNSILMFFLRLIKEIDPTLLQNHVISVISHLEQLKTISLRSDFLKDMKISPPFWCFFISGSDATNSEHQFRFDELARKWFVAGNKWIGKQVMMEVWKTNNSNNRDSNVEHFGDKISWLDVIKDWEISGFN
jgi:hypothetical protein